MRGNAHSPAHPSRTASRAGSRDCCFSVSGCWPQYWDGISLCPGLIFLIARSCQSEFGCAADEKLFTVAADFNRLRDPCDSFLLCASNPLGGRALWVAVTPSCFIAFATMSEPIAIGGSSAVVDSFSKFEEMAGREASQQLFGNGATFSSTIIGTGERRIAEKAPATSARQTTPSSLSVSRSRVDRPSHWA